MSEEDGGQAFPVSLFPGPMGDLHAGEPGMTLRDWFAGQAMPAVLRSFDAMTEERLVDHLDGRHLDAVASGRAYEIADAMLAERSK